MSNNVIAFPQKEEPEDIYEMNLTQLQAHYAAMQEELHELDAKEPKNMNSEAYEEWADEHEELEDYLELVGDCLKLLPQETVIHRLSGDGPKSILTAPLWSGNKRLVLNSMSKYLKEQNIYQGQDA